MHKHTCILFFILILGSFGCSKDDDLPVVGKDVVVLYDNDVHCAVDGYARFAALRDSLVMQNDVCLVSCGDFLSGGDLGDSSEGENIVRIMNMVGYDYVALGNHEFDFSVERLDEVVAELKAEVLCCNFCRADDKNPVYSSFSIRRLGNINVAFIGVVTPDALTYSEDVIPYFLDENGNYKYTFCRDEIFSVVQKQVDSAIWMGADIVVLLSHLGDESYVDVSSTLLISNTVGIDVVLDAHQHNVIPGRYVPNRMGKLVLLSSTGSNFKYAGELRIKSNGYISSKLIEIDSITTSNVNVENLIAEIRRGN